MNTRLMVTAGSAVALILFVAFIVSRLIRSSLEKLYAYGSGMTTP